MAPQHALLAAGFGGRSEAEAAAEAAAPLQGLGVEELKDGPVWEEVLDHERGVKLDDKVDCPGPKPAK
jgi:hypothetical protein